MHQQKGGLTVSIVVALDVSLNSPGWSKLDTENGARTFGSFDYSKLRDMPRIAKAACELIDLCRPADLVVMEGLSMGLPMGKNGRSFVPQGRTDLVGLTYVIRLWLFKQQKPTILVSPTGLKKFTTSDFKAPKDLMLREVFRRWGVEAENNDQADAVALAEVGRAWLEKPADLPKFQKEVLKKVTLLA
jgi:crossover junction endodeoxyribonuclease RuvC